MYKKILAIDFEAANSSRTSICAMGYVLVDGKKIIEREVLVNPEEYFDPFNIMIHGITEKDVQGAPLFTEIYKELIEIIDENTLVIAHNASYDMSLIRHTCDKYHLEYPVTDYVCTYKIAQKKYEGLLSYSLDSVAYHLNYDFEHHKAVEDAKACLEIYKDSTKDSDNIDSLLEELGLEKGKLFVNDYKPCRVKPKQAKNFIDVNSLVSKNEDLNPEHSFFQKKVVFTGKLQIPRKEAMQLVVDCGGVVGNGLTKDTDYLVMGVQDIRALQGNDRSSKVKKAEVYKLKGSTIELIGEDTFLNLL